MPTEWPDNLPYTVSMCDKCRQNCGIKQDSPTKIGGNLCGPCEICGHETYLYEFRTGVNAAQIRSDSR